MFAPACVEDYRLLAQRRLPRQFFDYLDGGSFAESTLRANTADLQAVRLRQRVLRDVSGITTRCSILGQELSLPLILAPIGLAGLMARRGEVQAARAAQAAGVPFCLSTVSICSLEEVQRATSGAFWFQLYVVRDRAYAIELLQRAWSAGCRTLVFTVDLPLLGTRYRDVRNGMAGGLSLGKRLAKAWDIARHPGWVRDVVFGGGPLVFGNLAAAVPGARNLAAFRTWVDAQFDPSVTWQDLSWIRESWAGSIVLKGILDIEDARTAAHIGADAIVVSNHGGRQLDSAPSSVSQLAAIVDAVGGELEILMDGGIRSGQDIVKAMAHGARACLVGRPWVYGLAARGQHGVTHVLDIIRRELEVTLALLGIDSVEKLSRGCLLE